MAKVRSLLLPPLYQDAPESGRLILRDGSLATIGLIRPEDKEAVREFFKGLSPESRYSRFFSMSGPDEKLLESLCHSDPKVQLALQVKRIVEGSERIIAVGSYQITDERSAEVSMAVNDRFHGKGIGTHLLERLALLAVRSGCVHFWATTHSTNKPMLDVFRNAGFETQEKREGGYIRIEFPVNPTLESIARSEMLDRVFTNASLRPFFQPNSIAVVGASRDDSSIGGRILKSLLKSDFQGPVYPVNPSANVVSSIRAFRSVRDIPEPVDLAVLVIPAEKVLSVVDDCAVRGVRALVVVSAGFAESGETGKQLQAELAQKTRGYGMRLVGPNCMGIVNTSPQIRMNASFSPVYPKRGRVALSSQSGALGLAILEFALQRNLGLSSFISVGNKADVSGNDLLQYWEEDPDTDVILLYLESFGNPRRFARIARRVSLRKPIVAVKSGRTLAGKRAAGSHTAAMAASDAAVDALFHQTGVIRANTLEEMFNLAAGLSSQPLPKGRRVGILTNAGGPGILCADMCEANELIVPEFSISAKEKLRSILPSVASVSNPVDMVATATAEEYQTCIEALLQCEEIDSLIAIYIPAVLDFTPTIRGIAAGVESGRKSGGAEKTVYACVMAPQQVGGPIRTANEAVPCFLFPESAAQVLGQVTNYADWRRRSAGTIPDYADLHPEVAAEICRRALKERGTGWLKAEEVLAILQSMQLPVVPSSLARTSREAVDAAKRIGYPVAMKVASRKIIHKTEAGGVVLNLADDGAVRKGFERIRKRVEQKAEPEAMDGVIVQAMILEGTELMMGVTEDPSFGPLIAFGLGGIHVEILKDVCFRVTPLTDVDASEMVREIKGFRLLEGYRGHAPADLAAIQRMLLKVSRLVETVPEISELDLNPIFAFPPGKGCLIADARIHVKK